MMGKKSGYRKITFLFAVLLIAAWLLSLTSDSFAGASVPTGGTMQSYCVVPPFIGGTAPPLVMMLLGNDHKLFLKAYDDYSDLDGDGQLDTTYRHHIDYYGYFDSYKCYRYSTVGGRFNPVGMADENKYCTASDDTWSGNFLNWATMTRMDVLRKAFYGGKRDVDNASTAPITVLERAFLPQDAHSFVKLYSGTDISDLTPYRNHPVDPTKWVSTLSICNTTKDSYNNPPLMRVAYGDDTPTLSGDPEGFDRWASMERYQCAFKGEVLGKTAGARGEFFRPANDSTGKLGDYIVRVAACQPGLIGRERCKIYEQHNLPKPIGLLQEYGEDTSMYFGLMTGSYDKNKSGGVLRRRLADVGDLNSGEINRANGKYTGFGKIIPTLDSMKIENYNYFDGRYNITDNCPWSVPSFNDGQCSNWGNPVGEMYYEALRVFSGKRGSTAAYESSDYLPEESWNNTDNNDPYTYSAECAEAFNLILSDPHPSYDGDQLPGSRFGSFTGDMAGLDVSALATEITSNEGISGDYFIGSVLGGSQDYQCTAKSVSDLGKVRGLCPNDPGTEGSYYLSTLAYYGKVTDLRPDDDPDTTIARTGNQNVSAYSVALGGTIPELKVNVGGSEVKIIPACFNYYSNRPCTLIDFQVRSISETDGAFDIYWDDSLQGGDYDWDVWNYLYYLVNEGKLYVYVASNKYGYSTYGFTIESGYIISGTLNDGPHLDIRQSYTMDRGDYCGDDINDTGGVNNDCASFIDYTPSATPSAEHLKDPLWYAAKYGGFRDIDGNGVPNLQSEWDADENGVPDTYFMVTNPLQLESKLREAFSSILNRVTSGTAASVLASGEGSGANLVQAIYYPRRRFFNSEIDWTGDLHAYWYYVDPFFENSSIREDSRDSESVPPDRILNLTQDDIVYMYFDQDALKTRARITPDTDGDGVADGTSRIVDFGDIDAIWKAGYYLWARDLVTDPRTIYVYNGVGLMGFSVANHGFLNPLMDVPDRSVPADGNVDETIDIIRYTMGEHVVADREGDGALDYRSRVADIDLNGDGDVFDTVSMDIDYDGTTENVRESNVWKLGDIVSSTPTILGFKRLNYYYDRYHDTTYKAYFDSAEYAQRDTIFTGANDGMLHAFKLGEYEYLNNYTQLLRLNKGSTDTVQKYGAERWAFMPLHALPYLKYLAQTDYCHVNTVDLSPYLFDAALDLDNDLSDDFDDGRTQPTGTGCSDPTPENCLKGAESWRSILIGGMRFGGACRPEGNTESDAVAAPNSLTYGTGQVDIGLSSYFALDVTDENEPEFMWQFPDPVLSPAALNSLGYSMSGPVIVKINGEEKDETNTLNPSPDTNGHWYAVFASGPTGPINTTEHQFMGRSNQNLKIFIVHLRTGRLVRVIDTGITEAFSGSILGSTLDMDDDYTDESLYIGYTYKDPASGPRYTWTKGGVVRLITNRSPNPADWAWSVLIDGIGPVTAAVSKIYNQENDYNWVYIGTGRYFYKLAAELDSATEQQALYGFLDKCFDRNTGDFFAACTDSDPMNDGTYKTDPGTLLDVTNIPDAIYDDVVAAGGWKILLDTDSWDDRNQVGYGAERVITNPVISEDNVYFTSVKPFSGACKLGGNSYVWVVKYDTGGAPRNLKGKALIQVSTGAIEEVNLEDALSDKGGRRIEGRTGVPPPAQGLALLGAPPPLQHLLHIRER